MSTRHFVKRTQVRSLFSMQQTVAPQQPVASSVYLRHIALVQQGRVFGMKYDMFRAALSSIMFLQSRYHAMLSVMSMTCLNNFDRLLCDWLYSLLESSV